MRAPERAKLFRTLDGPLLPFICAVLTLLAAVWVWIPQNFAPRLSDERAYLLQAEIFASGKWTLPARPKPEFFEQEHTFVTPFVAAKYPPGQSLVLTSGVFVGWPQLMPLLMAAAAGALVVILSRALTSAPVALLAWACWITLPPTLYYMPSYLSEVTTLVLWLLGWYALLRRVKGGGPSWLVLLGACIAWCIITRPLTGVAYALPTAAVALMHEYRRRVVGPSTVSFLVALAILSVIPLWSRNTTGSWTRTPLMQYTATYIPWDVPGFGTVAAKPLRSLPDDIQRDLSRFEDLHSRHVVRALPTIAFARAKGLLGRVSPTRHVFLLITVLIVGLAAMPRAARIGIITSVVLFASYLTYATPPEYPLYYLETFPVVGFTLAAGIAAIIRFLLRRYSKPGNVASLAMVAAALVVIVSGLSSARRMRTSRGGVNRFRVMIDVIQSSRNVVFARYGASPAAPLLLVWNPAYLEKARTIVVFDRGEMNDSLLTVFPDRHPYLLDVAAGQLREIALDHRNR